MTNAGMPDLKLVPPTKQVRIGLRKVLRVKRAQDVIEILAWSSVVAVTAMFLIDGGLKNVTDVGTAANAIARLTALVGTDLLLIHMLLVARVPWIDKFYGHDKATVAHKKLGKPVLYLIAAHFIASLVEYSISNSESIIDTFFWFITDVQDMLLATIGFVLMVVVVITSLNFARRAMSYEAWFFVHLISYVSVAVAVPHIFSSGEDVVGKPIQTTFWVTLYLFVFLNIIVFRVYKPIRKTLRKSLKLEKIVHESSDTSSLYLAGKHLENIEGVAGQFYFLRPLTPTQWWRPHPFSLSAAPNGQYLRFTIGDRGDDTSLLRKAKVGTRFAIEGPYGLFTEDRRVNERVVLIASGIGIPPIRALAETMASRPGDITVIYRVRTKQDAALLNEIEEVCARRGHNLFVIEGPRGKKNSWLNSDGTDRPDVARLFEMVPHVIESDVYICGPQGWTDHVVRTVRAAGANPNFIHSEEYAW